MSPEIKRALERIMAELEHEDIFLVFAMLSERHDYLEGLKSLKKSGFSEN